MFRWAPPFRGSARRARHAEGCLAPGSQAGNQNKRRGMAFRRARRTVSRAAAGTLLISAVAVGMTVSAPHALAAGTVLFNQPFHDNTVDGPAGSVSLPAAPTRTTHACLT